MNQNELDSLVLNEIEGLSSDEVLRKLQTDMLFFERFSEVSLETLKTILPIARANETLHRFLLLGVLPNSTAQISRVALYMAMHRHESVTPPKAAELLLLMIPIRQREHLVGDLEEEFRTVTVPRHGKRAASFLYAWQVGIEIVRAIVTGLSGITFGWFLSKLSK